MVIVDTFEYKGKEVKVQKDENSKFHFTYEENGKEVILPFEEMQNFINGQFSHTSIGENKIDMIERSVKINDFIYPIRELKARLKKYA